MKCPEARKNKFHKTDREKLFIRNLALLGNKTLPNTLPLINRETLTNVAGYHAVLLYQQIIKHVPSSFPTLFYNYARQVRFGCEINSRY